VKTVFIADELRNFPRTHKRTRSVQYRDRYWSTARFNNFLFIVKKQKKTNARTLITSATLVIKKKNADAIA